MRWAAFEAEINDIRDITFYIKNGGVAFVEMTEPYEMRYVYGYDRDAGLNRADERRKKLNGENMNK